jgi:hypothetical protein
LNTLSFLGVLKMQLQDFTGAIGIYMEVLERIDTTTQVRHALNAYEGLSEAYHRINQEEKAALFRQKAMATAKGIQRSDTISPVGTEGIAPALDDTIMPAGVPLR